MTVNPVKHSANNSLPFLPPATKLGQGNVLQASVILLTGGCASSRGVSAHGGVCSQGGVCSGRVSAWGGWWRHSPGRLLLRAVRILLECILVYILGVEYVIAESHPLELRFESLLCLDVNRLSKIPPVSRLVIAGICRPRAISIH